MRVVQFLHLLRSCGDARRGPVLDLPLLSASLALIGKDSSLCGQACRSGSVLGVKWGAPIGMHKQAPATIRQIRAGAYTAIVSCPMLLAVLRVAIVPQADQVMIRHCTSRPHTSTGCKCGGSAGLSELGRGVAGLGRAGWAELDCQGGAGWGGAAGLNGAGCAKLGGAGAGYANERARPHWLGWDGAG